MEARSVYLLNPEIVDRHRTTMIRTERLERSLSDRRRRLDVVRPSIRSVRVRVSLSFVFGLQLRDNLGNVSLLSPFPMCLAFVLISKSLFFVCISFPLVRSRRDLRLMEMMRTTYVKRASEWFL